MKESIENINPSLLEEDDRITSYLKGKMTNEEEVAFMEEVKKNPELKAKAIAMARLVKGLKEAGRKHDEEIRNILMASNEKEIKEVTKDVVKKQKSNFFSIKKASLWMSMAASLALVLWLGYGYYDYKKTTGLGDEYVNAFQTSLITRGEDASNESQIKLQKLFDNIKSDTEIEKSIHDLTLYWELSKMETYNDYTDYSNEIGWNLAIGYLKNNDKKNAKKVLSQLLLQSEPDTAIFNKAKELLNKIE
jgi:hypothetical protein